MLLTDLEPSTTGTRYFGESQYVTPEDSHAGNQNNNYSCREITSTGSGSVYNFAFNGGSQRMQSAIQALKDLRRELGGLRIAAGPSKQNATIRRGRGRVRSAASAMGLPPAAGGLALGQGIHTRRLHGLNNREQRFGGSLAHDRPAGCAEGSFQHSSAHGDRSPYRGPRG